MPRIPTIHRRFPKEGERPAHGYQASGAGKSGPLLRVAGLAAVSALFRHDPDRVVRLFYEDKRVGEVGEFCGRMAQFRRPYRKVDADELTRIAGTVLHGGVVAVAEHPPEHRLTVAECNRLAASGNTLFVLDGIGNPHNVGAIARSLAFFGFRHLVLTDHPQQAGLSDAAYRIAEGGLDCLTIFRAARLAGLLQQIKGDYRIVGTALSSRGQPLEALHNPSQPSLIILGNEERGLSRETLNQCDVVLTLPGSGEVQSLNVSATAAIMAYVLQPR